MWPLFLTYITNIYSVFFCHKWILIQVSWETVLTGDVCHGTTMLQSVNSGINALLKGKIQSNLLQVFLTDGCILIRQVQLLALWFTRQGISHYVQWSLFVQYHNEQLIHPFKPTCLTSTKVWLCKYMLPWFLVGIHSSWYTIYVTLPLDTCLEYCQ